MPDISTKACEQFFRRLGILLDSHALSRLEPYLDGKHGEELQRVAQTVFEAHTHNLSARFDRPKPFELSDTQVRDLAAAISARSSQIKTESVPTFKNRRRARAH